MGAQRREGERGTQGEAPEGAGGRTMKETPRAVIVPRVSSLRQAEEGTSLEAQELACLHKSADIGAQVVGVYRDEGVSGARYLTRPGIQAALSDIEAGRANTLVTYKLDRAGRDVEILRDIKRRVERAGGSLVFADGTTFKKNATGDLLYTQLAAFAEYERASIRERTMSGRRRRAQQGIQPQRARHAFGYHIVTEKDVLSGEYSASQIGRYLIDEERAPWAREAFLRFAEGESLRQVCFYLDGRVPPSRGGRCWRPQSL